MKKITLNFLLVIAICLAFITVRAQTIRYDDAWAKAGFTLENQNDVSVSLTFSVDEFTFSGRMINGVEMQELALPGTFLPNDEGAPNLPGQGRLIAIPQGARAVLTVKNFRTEKFENIELAPAPRIPLDTDRGPLHYEKNERLYSRNAFYPDQPVKISHPTKIRGVDAVMLGITPFQYNPVTKELIVYRDIEVEITFEGGNGRFGEDSFRSRWWDPIMNDIFFNYGSLPEIDYNARLQKLKNSDATGCEYLVVVPNDAVFSQWADSVKKFRQRQGIITQVKTLTEIGGSTASILEDYFDDAYNNWDIKPVAVLLMADYGTNAGNRIISPNWGGQCVSDNIYADVTGNSMPDIIFARMTAQNATHLETMVTKFINYERTLPTNPGFYNHPITALGWQTTRWFQICSESVGGFWNNVLGKETNRINDVYDGNPNVDPWSTATNTSTVLNVFGPNGLGYIPASPSELGGWTGGNATMVNDGINSGAFILQHRDHGGETGWGEPSYHNSDIDGLYNSDLTFVFSINCLTGKFNSSVECFAEKFHRHTYSGQNAGALGVIAASETSYSFVNDTYVWGMYDNMWPDFLPQYGPMPVEERGVYPAFGNAAGKYFLQQSSWPYNTGSKEVTYFLFHHHGDAFTTVYYEMPQNLTVVHNPVLYSGESSFTVTADAGSFIALTVNDEVIGVAEGTGAPVSIAIEPQTPPAIMFVTVTKQNYYRYESAVEVIPPAGPYVVFDSYEINDYTENNGNGLLDYGESVLLSFSLKNVGVENASNITATIFSADPYITITDNSEFFGDIGPDGTVTVADAFAFDAANNIPDGHVINFQVDATDGNDTWVSYFSIQGHAPVLEMGDFVINDPTGNNNGKIDPGETVDIIITVENNGTSEAFNVLGQLQSSDPYITIVEGEKNYGNITGGNQGQQSFVVSAGSSAPAGHIASFNMDITADLSISGNGTFDVVIGQIPILILDLDDNTSSGPDMLTAIQNLGATAEYSTSFPPDLNLYVSIFVCLGIYSNNHVLTSGEGQIFANYLNYGGSLYIEGGDTWYWDPATAVHAMFNIDPTSDGSSNMGTVLGQAGTFTEGMTFNYGGENNWMDHIEPISPAFKIFQNQNPSYGCGVAYDAGDYKTIGTSFEFGGLGGPSSQDDLMEEFLLFFGIFQSGVLADFIADQIDVCEGGSAQFTDISTGGVTAWEWEFEGGEPSVSNEQNPLVTYDIAGTYDVTLTVYGTSSSNTLTKSDYINVVLAPGMAATPTGETLFCENPSNKTYQSLGAAHAEFYEWVVEPTSAGVISGTGLSVIMNWADDFSGLAEIKVRGINICGEGEFSDPLLVTIEPLPDNSGAITGNTLCCQGSADVFSIDEILYAESYEWILSPGAAGELTQSDNSCSVLWSETWDGLASLKVRGVNNCGNGDWSDGFEVVVMYCSPGGLPPGWEFTPNAVQHIIVIPVEANPVIFGTHLNAGDYIGVFYTDNGVEKCGGAVEWNMQQNKSIMAFGDDFTTPEKDGFNTGETFIWKLYSWSEEVEYPAAATYDTAFPNANGTFYPFGISSLISLQAYTTQAIYLNSGWGGFSSCLEPVNSDIENIFDNIIGDVIIVQNDNYIFWPGQQINTFPGWEVTFGAQIKMLDNADLIVNGFPAEKTVALVAGWDYLPVLSTCPVESSEIFGGIQDKIEIVKEIAGWKAYWPAYGIFTLDYLTPGNAYLINLTESVNLTFPACSDQGASYEMLKPENLTPWNDVRNTPASHLFAINSDINFHEDDFIGAFTPEGICAGMIKLNGQSSALTVFGDDPFTSETDGFTDGETILFKLYRPETNEVIELKVSMDNELPDNDGRFVGNGISAFKEVTTVTGSVAEIGNGVNIFPNPSEGIFTISGLSGVEEIIVTTIEGQDIFRMNLSGETSVKIDLTGYPKGIYFIRLSGYKTNFTTKLTCI